MSFKICSATIPFGQTLVADIVKAVECVPANAICGVVVYGTDSSMEYHQMLDYIAKAICEAVGKRVPVTLVPQPLLPQGGCALDIYTLDGAAEVRIEQFEGVCYGLLGSGEEQMIFVEGIVSSDFGAGVAEQSREIFEKLEKILAKYDYLVDDIVRQWNYIGNIVNYRHGKQNYQEFNDARTIYYNKGVWSNGYPAATGIGASFEGVVVGCIAFKNRHRKAVYPIDNPLQVAAHIYSKDVLIDNAANAVKSTPKFERAKLIETAQGVCCFVSGTAAIRGEQSVDACSVGEQTIRTIENIECLVSKQNLLRSGCRAYDLKYAKLHIFVKHAEDFESVRTEVSKAYPQVAVTYSVADVCRSELLVEIEGILIS